MSYYLDINKSIVFHDSQNPIPEIQQQLQKWPFIQGTKYLGIYITPHTKKYPDKDIHSIYYQIKYKLLNFKITSQVIETETINSSSFNFLI